MWKIAVYLFFVAGLAIAGPGCCQNNYVWRAGADENAVFRASIKSGFFYDYTNYKKDALIHSRREISFMPPLILLPFERYDYQCLRHARAHRDRHRKLCNTYSYFRRVSKAIRKTCFVFLCYSRAMVYGTFSLSLWKETGSWTNPSEKLQLVFHLSLHWTIFTYKNAK